MNPQEKIVLLTFIYKKYYARCFWSYRKDKTITLDDENWIKTNLLKHAGRACLKDYQSLCR